MQISNGIRAGSEHADAREPFDWTDAEPNFEVPEWRALGAQYASPKVFGRHFLFVGETGSGKTKSGILPILRAALRYGERHPELAPTIFVIDPKFELAGLVAGMSPTPPIVIGTSAPLRRVALFEGKPATLDAFTVATYTLENCSSAYVASATSRESFWRDRGFAIIESLIAADIERSLQGETLWEGIFRVGDEGARKHWLDFDIVPGDDARNPYVNSLKLLAGAFAQDDYATFYAFNEATGKLGVSKKSLLPLQGLIPWNAERMRAGEVASALTFLRDLANDTLNASIDLRARNVGAVESDDALVIRDCIDRGARLVFQPDSASPVNDVVGRVLKTKIFEASLLRSDKRRPIFYIADEAHRFVTADPESGEQGFLDRCRAFRVICALATQSIASLRNGLAASATSASGHLDSVLSIIVNNTANKLIFRTTDPQSQESLKSAFPRSPVRGDPHVLDVYPLSSLSPGECYYAFADGRTGRDSVALDHARTASARASRASIARILKPISVAEAIDVCDRVGHRMRYFYERDVSFEIDCPGGDAVALDYFLRNFERWRSEGSQVATFGLGHAGSAAALMLCFGDVGRRRALRTCRLLFHRTRFPTPKHTTLTASNVKRIGDRLRAADDAIEFRLAKHLFGRDGLPLPRRSVDFGDPRLEELDLAFRGVRVLTEASFLELYGLLAERDQTISTEQAQVLGLIDEIVD